MEQDNNDGDYECGSVHGKEHAHTDGTQKI